MRVSVQDGEGESSSVTISDAGEKLLATIFVANDSTSTVTQVLFFVANVVIPLIGSVVNNNTYHTIFTKGNTQPCDIYKLQAGWTLEWAIDPIANALAVAAKTANPLRKRQALPAVGTPMSCTLQIKVDSNSPKQANWSLKAVPQSR